jgi:hypothetical protein
MRRLVIIAMVMLAPMSLIGQELVSTISIDTSQYESIKSPINSLAFCLGPTQPYSLIGYPSYVTATTFSGIPTMSLFALLKKNSNQYDIFSFTGKIGSIIIPLLSDSIGDARVFISQTFINNDDGWESIVDYYNRDGAFLFKLYNENGNVLLSDSGEAFYWFDGQNTYVSSHYGGYTRPVIIKTWKFRSNISSSFSPGLGKTAGQSVPIMQFGPTGDMRVSLQPASGGKTSVQLFDMLGRIVYTKIVDNINQAVSFTVLSNQVPNSPFLSKVKNGNGTNVQTMFPMR